MLFSPTVVENGTCELSRVAAANAKALSPKLFKRSERVNYTSGASVTSQTDLLLRRTHSPVSSFRPEHAVIAFRKNCKSHSTTHKTAVLNSKARINNHLTCFQSETFARFRENQRSSYPACFRLVRLQVAFKLHVDFKK